MCTTWDVLPFGRKPRLLRSRVAASIEARKDGVPGAWFRTAAGSDAVGRAIAKVVPTERVPILFVRAPAAPALAKAARYAAFTDTVLDPTSRAAVAHAAVVATL